MFYNCSSLQTLDLSSFNTANGADMNYTFRNCSSLKNIKVGKMTNKSKIDSYSFDGIGENGILLYPKGTDYSKWLEYLGGYGWIGQEY